MAPSPQDWANRLVGQIRRQSVHAREFDDYYTGSRRLAIVEREYLEVFGQAPTSATLAELVPPDTNVSSVGVDALVERLQIEGWSALGVPAGEQAVAESARIEVAAGNLWTGSDMDVMQSVAITEALVKSRSFLLNSEGPDGAVISVEDPEQVAVARDVAPPYDVVAALKVAPDPWGGPDMSTLWLPGARYPLRRKGPGWDVGAGERSSAAVPVVELAYRSRLLAEPESYIKRIASLADSYALLMAYLVIAARFGAVPIVTMSGVKLPRSPEGMVLPFGADPARPERAPRRIGAQNALATEDPAGRFGRIEAGELAGFIGAIEMLTASIVALHRTPAHYYGQGARSGTSGETLKASEAGLTRRRQDASRYLGAGFRRAVSDGVSTDLGRPVRVAPRWADTETRLETQIADAFTKYVAGGLPLRTTLEHLGFPAATVERAMTLAASERTRADALLEAVAARTGAGGDSAGLDRAADLDPDDPRLVGVGA